MTHLFLRRKHGVSTGEKNLLLVADDLFVMMRNRRADMS